MAEVTVDKVSAEQIIKKKDILERAPGYVQDASKRGLGEVAKQFWVEVRGCEPYPIETVKKRLPYYVHDPLLWGREVVGYIPDPQQKAPVGRYLEDRFTTMRSGHNTGKSCSLSIMSLHFLSTRHFSIVPTTAPSQHQLHDILWKEHAKWIRRSPYLDKLLEWTYHTVKVRGYGAEWHAIARTSRAGAGDTSNVGLQGFHAGPHSGGLLYVIDEASGVPESSMNAVEGALAEPDVYVAMGGNPTHLSGTFYDSFHKDEALWPAKYVLNTIKSLVTDPAYAPRIGQKYGLDSDEYRIKVLGEFPLQEAFGLIRMSDVQLAFMLRPDEVIQENQVESGLDVALSGANRTILYARQGNHVFYKKQCNETVEDKIADWTIHEVEKLGISVLTVDAIGPGSGVCSHLRTKGYKRLVKQFKSGEKPVGYNKSLGHDEDEEFFNIRAQAYWYLRSLFVNGQLALTYAKDDADLRVQLASLMVDRTSDQSRLQIESKQRMRDRGMDSPDEADSLMLCFASDLDKTYKTRIHKTVTDFQPVKPNVFVDMMQVQGSGGDIETTSPFDRGSVLKTGGFWDRLNP